MVFALLQGSRFWGQGGPDNAVSQAGQKLARWTDAGLDALGRTRRCLDTSGVWEQVGCRSRRARELKTEDGIRICEGRQRVGQGDASC